MIQFCRHSASFKLWISKVQGFGNFELSPMHLEISSDILDRVERSYEPTHEILVLITSSSNEGSEEPAQMCRLARVFPARIHKEWI